VSEHDTKTETLGEPTRRDFLYIAAGMAGAVGAVSVAWPFIDQMRPDQSTLALASIEVDNFQPHARHVADGEVARQADFHP
jgi:ubiquinol-cytochrome c reductase iron-sulfur subunit